MHSILGRPVGRPSLVHALFYLAFCLVLAVPRGAHARELTLPLRSGGIISGELISALPGQWITLPLPTGATQTLRWEELLEPPTDLAATPATEPPPAPPAPPIHISPWSVAPQPGQPPPSGYALTHVRTNRPGTEVIRLQPRLNVYTSRYGSRFYGQSSGFNVVGPVCIAPCDVSLAAGTYRIDGPNLTPSRPFELPSTGLVTIDARVGSRPAHRGGIALTDDLPPGVLTHVRSDRHGIKLLRVQARDWFYAASRSGYSRRIWVDSLEPVCTAPCSVPAEPGTAYRVGGEGFTPSRPFFVRNPGPVTVDVRAGLLSRHRAGVGLTYTGLSLSLLGVTLFAAVGAASASPSFQPDTSPVPMPRAACSSASAPRCSSRISICGPPPAPASRWRVAPSWAASAWPRRASSSSLF